MIRVPHVGAESGRVAQPDRASRSIDALSKARTVGELQRGRHARSSARPSARSCAARAAGDGPRRWSASSPTSRSASSSASRVGAVVATIHDLLITMAFLAFFRYDLTLNVIAAILTITGYSTNDTIVIFDRVRENLRGMRRDSLRHVDQRVDQPDAGPDDHHRRARRC